MNAKEFVKNSVKIEGVDFSALKARLEDPKMIRLLHAGLGLNTEGGEFLDTIKRTLFYDKELDRTNLIEELGDIFWYAAVASDVLGVSFSEIMEKNTAKLKARYGDSFSKEKALNRDLSKEHEILDKETKNEK